jgi:hypothetical protein
VGTLIKQKFYETMTTRSDAAGHHETRRCQSGGAEVARHFSKQMPFPVPDVMNGSGHGRYKERGI